MGVRKFNFASAKMPFTLRQYWTCARLQGTQSNTSHNYYSKVRKPAEWTILRILADGGYYEIRMLAPPKRET